MNIHRHVRFLGDGLLNLELTSEALEGFFQGYRDIGHKLKGIRDIFVNI